METSVRECKHFKNWSEHFVNVECLFFGNKTKTCLHDEMGEYWICPWQGKPAIKGECHGKRV
jgi:hypothetical protein